MVAKCAILLLLVGACLAYPADEEPRQPQAADPVQLVQPLPFPPQLLSQPPKGFQDPQNPQGPLQPGLDAPLPGGPVPSGLPQGPDGKPESNDLKTDSTFWFGGSFGYPYYRRSYHRSYYRPRSYSYYYNPYYSYWNPYSYTSYNSNWW